MYDTNLADEYTTVMLDDSIYFYISFDKWIYLDENKQIVYE